ncbi:MULTISPECIES: agmatinase [unclassified Microbacterium]|uniref:agmatinase n=1 Tax=unclassified Microbacterium TaxID=2609290 RepID=UPI000EA94646|nr:MULTISPECIES: agmatinase [unclassified Microbacterium]MBT2483871.1 agmatinase [Microbacterium sp. ISL-108]RKN66852.1 agmatinase [Microbacterium sp. CGR2]
MSTTPIGPADASKTPRYAGLSTFARLPRIEDVGDVDLAIVGIPFDSGVSYRPGARFGPEHVRASSRLLRPYNPAQDFAGWEAVQMADAGDIAVNPFHIEEAVRQIAEAATELGSRVDRILTIGGDHTIAYPLLKAISEKHGPVAVLHFDAHLDTWDTYFDEPITHGTPFRRASEDGYLDRTASVHVGTRGPLYSRQDLDDDEVLGFAIVTSEDIEEHGVPAALDRIRQRVGDRPLYISIDIDVLDPAHAPGTGTPEAGGLTSRELLRLLRGLTDLHIVGCDVVEVAPAYDHAQVTGIAASHVAYELMTAMAQGIVRERAAATKAGDA